MTISRWGDSSALSVKGKSSFEVFKKIIIREEKISSTPYTAIRVRVA